MVPKKPLGPFAVFTQEVAETGQFAVRQMKLLNKKNDYELFFV